MLKGEIKSFQCIEKTIKKTCIFVKKIKEQGQNFFIKIKQQGKNFSVKLSNRVQKIRTVKGMIKYCVPYKTY